MRLRTHTYLCRQCGAGRVNAQDERGHWTMTLHLPDGTSVVAPRAVPPCEPGPKTAAALRKYADAL